MRILHPKFLLLNGNLSSCCFYKGNLPLNQLTSAEAPFVVVSSIILISKRHEATFAKTEEGQVSAEASAF